MPTQGARRLPGSSGSRESTNACSRPVRRPDLRIRHRREEGIDGNHEATRREGPGARHRRRTPHRLGGPADARAAGDPRPLRAGAAARRAARLGVPARDHGDGQPRPRAEGRRRRRRPLRVQSAVHPGRRRGGARRGVRHLCLCDQGRGQRLVLPAHRGRGRSPSPPDDGRRRRRDRRAALAPARAAR